MGLIPLGTFAVRTSSFLHTSYEDFVNGEFSNVALSNMGLLELAPSLDLFVELDEPIVWVAASDREGNLILGTGNYGKVIKVDPEGEVTTLFAPEEVLSRSLVIAEDGDVFVGTSPTGRVYRIPPKGRPEVYFDPPESYIWDMTFDDDGNLYVATGNAAVIYMLPKDFQTNDTPITWFKCEQTHLTTLAWDIEGNLLAGSSPGGILYRIDSEGSGFALYNTAAQEIRQILVGEGGKIFISTFSTRIGGVNLVTSQPEEKSGEENTFTVTAKRFGGTGTNRTNNSRNQNGTGSSTIFTIDREGFVEAYWGLPRSHIFSMFFAGSDELIIGTNDKGRLFSVHDRGDWRLLQQTPTGGEISVLHPPPNGEDGLYLITSNPARIYRLKGSPSSSGEYISKVYDARQIAKWGRVLAVSGNAIDSFESFATRTGNTEEADATWSEWTPVTLTESGLLISSPVARYIQYRIEFEPEEGGSGGSGVQQVRIFYQSKNVAPQIGAIRIVPVGFQVLTTVTNPPNVDLNKLIDEKDPDKLIRPPSPRRQLKAMGDEGMLTVAWKGIDPNEDRLLYSLSIQSIEDSIWIKLAEEIEEPVASFNTNGFNEGFYRVKVSASDAPDNGQEKALNGDRISEIFLIDNSPPQIEVSRKSVVNHGIELEFRSHDSFSIHQEASFTLDGQPSESLRPVDGLFDSTLEEFEISLEGLGPGAHGLVLEVIDENGRSGILTVSFEIPE